MQRRRFRYGPERSQIGNLWRPASAAAALPTIVLLHGGFWRPLYTKVIMRPLARRLVAEGWAVWNVEYRRVGRGGGWPTTHVDVDAAIDFLAGQKGLDLERVVVCGHSAGGNLALWSASRAAMPAGILAGQPKVTPCGVVSLAGVVDLTAAAKRESALGPVTQFMGGSPADLPDAYAAASPFGLLPTGIPQVLVHGLDDAVIPARASERYQQAAVAAGDDARYVPVPGVGHRQIVSPRAASWPLIVDELGRLLSRS